MEKIISIAEHILKVSANDTGGYYYNSQVNCNRNELEKVFKILAPYGTILNNELIGASPIFKINDIGRIFIANGGWSEKERIEKITKNRYIVTRNISLLTLISSILFGLLAFCSCNTKQPQEQQAPISHYVYMDESGTLHTRLHCVAIGKEPGEFGGADRSVTRYLKEDITASMLDYTCSRCVNDSMYEKLKEIAK